jgi:glucose/arabinose dehydrogenase
MRRTLLPFSAMAQALLVSVTILLASAIGPAHGAASVPPGFTQSPVVADLADSAGMEFAPDGRLFIAQDTGTLLIAKPDGTQMTFLDISAKVDSTGECGLLGLTFDPSFATNHYVYLHYTKKATATTPAHNRVVRVTARDDKAIAGSEKLIFRLDSQSETCHMGER